MPELARLQALEVRGGELDRALAEAGGRRDDVVRRQRRAEDELAAVEAKLAEVRDRLYSGTVGLIRELQALQAEEQALARRAGGLEDEVLQAMEEREPLDAEVSALEEERAVIDGEAGRVRAAVAEARATIDADLAREAEARATAAEGLPEAVMAEYERLRARLDGVGAAPLVNGRCGGCHLSLSVTELARLTQEPPDALVFCEQCGRILVR